MANQISTDEENQEQEIDDINESTETIPFTYAISSYGADYPVDSIVKRMNTKDILVPTFHWEPLDNTKVVGFQREYVWPRSKADRFIESLLLGLPVPGIFLAKEDSGVLLVLDGHQRLHTLHAFYNGVINGKEYLLQNVQDPFNNKRYKDLDPEERRRLDDSIIHATVIKQDQPSDDLSSIYLIFERLNTGGMNLQPQEIRVALFHGKYVQILQELNNSNAWRTLYGARSKRLKDMEMILRFFSFLYYGKTYKSPMKDFLNRSMGTNRNLAKQSSDELQQIFFDVTQTILKGIGRSAFRPTRSVNAAVIDSVMTGVAKRILDRGPIHDYENLKQSYIGLLNNEVYKSAIQTGTSQETNVDNRMKLAEQAFAEIP